MNIADFRSRAYEIFGEIPAEFLEGLDGLSVVRESISHPDLPEIYTLGECITESYPSEFGGPGEVRSVVVLYYGSFRALADSSDGWNWEEELWETITHEVQHHLESRAADESLEVRDYAEDQNYCRREGRPFEAAFYRSGRKLGPDLYQVGGDLFMEMTLSESDFAGMTDVVFRGDGTEISVPRPDRIGDVHFLIAAEAGEDAGERVLVLVKRRGAFGWLKALFTPTRLDILQSRAPGRS